MNSIINLFASVSGLWKKAASFLPLASGAGSVLLGAGGICVEIGHAPNAAGLLALLKALPSDPNMALIIAGLTALGIHTNHQANAAQLAATPPVQPPVA